MTYLREGIIDYADALEADTLVSISEAIHNTRVAEELRNLVKECDELDDN